MSKFNKVIHDSEIYYREFNESTGYYVDTVLTEEELIEQLLAEVVVEVIEIDREQIDRAISFIPDFNQKELLQSYINYLERLTESLEITHIKK